MQILQAPPAAGGAAWSLAGSCAAAGGSTGTWTYVSDVANVDFTNLGSFNELMIILRGVAASASGSRLLSVSTDNGSTYRTTSGDYVTVAAAGTETAAVGVGFHTLSSAAARSAFIRIPQAGLNGVPKVIEGINAATHALFVQSTSPINALRINNTSGNLTAGSIYVLGR